MRGAGALDEALIVVGGAALSGLWMQIIADVTGRPVLTIEQDVEARWAPCFSPLMVRTSSLRRLAQEWVTRPRSASVAIYDAVFESCKALYPVLKDSMHDLHDQAARPQQHAKSSAPHTKRTGTRE